MVISIPAKHFYGVPIRRSTIELRLLQLTCKKLIYSQLRSEVQQLLRLNVNQISVCYMNYCCLMLLHLSPSQSKIIALEFPYTFYWHNWEVK